MSKTCPCCGYRPIGPFTDNCPICAEPVRNVRSDGAGGGSGAGFPWRLFLGVGVGLVLGVAGCCGSGMWRMGSAIEDAQKQLIEAQAKALAERKERTVVITAADLLQDFQQDADAADRKYKGKFLELSGVVERHGKGANRASFVILHGGDDDAQIKIECFFDFMDVEERFDKGQAVTVQGEYAGRISHVQVRGCALK